MDLGGSGESTAGLTIGRTGAARSGLVVLSSDMRSFSSAGIVIVVIGCETLYTIPRLVSQHLKLKRLRGDAPSAMIVWRKKVTTMGKAKE